MGEEDSQLVLPVKLINIYAQVISRSRSKVTSSERPRLQKQIAMSRSGGKSSGQFSFAAPGGNASQSSPGSINDASSVETATVITMPSTSQASGNGRVAPLETTSAGSDARIGNAKRIVKRLTRSTSPRTTSRRSYREGRN